MTSEIFVIDKGHDMTMSLQDAQQDLSERWISFAGMGSERLAKKLGLSFEDVIYLSTEEFEAFDLLLSEERAHERAVIFP